MGKYLLAHDLGTSGNKATYFPQKGNSSLVAHIIMMFITLIIIGQNKILTIGGKLS